MLIPACAARSEGCSLHLDSIDDDMLQRKATCSSGRRALDTLEKAKLKLADDKKACEEKARAEETAARLGIASKMIAAACEVVTPERRHEQWRPEAGSPGRSGAGEARGQGRVEAGAG